MSGQECGRCDESVGEELAGERLGKRGQDRPIWPGRAWSIDLAAEDGEFVA
jgi:hypothetical protein